MRTLITFLLLASVALGAMATNLPNYYPSEFRYVGLVQEVNTLTHIITVNGRPFAISPNIQVHTLNKPYDTIKSIRRGDKIGFRMKKTKLSKRMLLEIWLLPRDYPLDMG